MTWFVLNDYQEILVKAMYYGVSLGLFLGLLRFLLMYWVERYK